MCEKSDFDFEKDPDYNYDDDFEYEDTGGEDNTCEGCGRGELDSGCCPLCCNHSFAPGTEDCDFCEHYEECLNESN